jgi:DNA-binding PadR family transcriptional regulator
MADPTLLVLASLANGEKHGYAILLDVECFAGLRLGPGTLYGAITRLEQQEWIRRVPSDDRRQPYAITSAGREYLTAQVDQLSRVIKNSVKTLETSMRGLSHFLVSLYPRS